MKTTFRLLLLFLLIGRCWAGPSDYNAASGYGTRITGGSPTSAIFTDILPALDGPFYDPLDSEVQMQSITLASEVNEGNGFTRLGFTVVLSNTSDGYYEELGIEWEPVGRTWTTVGDAQSFTGPEWHGVPVPDTFGWMPDLPPGPGTTARAQPYEVRVPTAERNAAVADILAGRHLRPVGIELFQFTRLPKAIDQATDNAFLGIEGEPPPGHSVVYFSQMTPLLASLQPGEMLVESAYHQVIRRGVGVNQFAPMLSDIIASIEGGPITVWDGLTGLPSKQYMTRLQRVVSVVTQQDGTIKLDVVEEGWNAVFRVGSVFQGTKQALDPDPSPVDPIPMRNLYRPPFSDGVISNSFRALQPESILPDPPDRSAERLLLRGHPSLGFGFRPMHMNFNDIGFLNNTIRLGGEILLDAMHLELKFRLRLDGTYKITVKMASKAEMTMRLAAGAGANNSNESEVDKEKTLFNIPLARMTIPIGPAEITITPKFSGLVGVNVNVPTQVVIPMHGSVEAGSVLTYDSRLLPGERVSYRPYHKTDPLEITNPLLNDSLACTATAFAEAGLEATVSVWDLLICKPYVGARVSGKFELNPSLPKWWKVDMDIATKTKMSVKVTALEVGDGIGQLSDGITFASKDAGGAVQRGSGAPGGSPPGPFDPVSGGDTRWSRMAGLGASAVRLAKVIGSAEDVFAAADGALVAPPIMRLGTRGEVLWAKAANFIAGQRLSPTPDGGLVFVGAGGTATIVWMDGAGNATHARLFQPQDQNNLGQVFYLGGIQAMPDGSVFVTGSIATPGDAHDPFLAKYDAAKNLVFFKRYETTNMLESITGMCLHPSGDLILCGISDGGGAPSTRGGLLMRITPAGTLVWATRTLSPIAYKAVTCSPDGTIYATGTFTRTITLDWPSILVARHYPTTGMLEFAVLVGENMGSPPTQPGEVIQPGVKQDYLAAGCSAWDEPKSICWTPNGLIVTGTTANLPDTNTRAGVTFCMTERMGLRWFTTHDGNGGDDVLFDAVPTAEGIFTTGYTQRFGTTNGDAWPALFTKLPKEGRLDLPGIAGYLIPSVMALPPFDGYDLGSPTPPQGYQGIEELSFVEAAQNVFSQAIATPVFTDVGVPMSPFLQVDPSTGETVTTNFDFWRLKNFPGNFHNAAVSGGYSDPDSDGVNNFFEYALGLTPLTRNAAPTGNHFNGIGQSLFSFSRIADPSLLYQVQASNDLLNWTPIYTSSGANNQPGVFEVPDPGPIVDGRRFYRLSVTQ